MDRSSPAGPDAESAHRADTDGSRPSGAHQRVVLAEFVATQTGSAVVLLAATLLALTWANSPWRESYDYFWELPLTISAGDLGLSLSIRHWINDGLMALF